MALLRIVAKSEDVPFGHGVKIGRVLHTDDFAERKIRGEQ
jgi:hypothetical protein